jgi:hypothetical protein
MAYGTVNADVIGTSVANSNLGAGNATRFKNRIINGDMRIDQRNAGASVSNIVGGVYTLDRWSAAGYVASKFTVQQNAASVTPPAGFTNYLGCTSSSAYTVGASEYFDVNQCIEGLNMADLGWGTSDAKTVTISFWVRSSLTGTFGGAINNSGDTRSYPFTYTINSANTWEQKTITIAGDTSGTWLKTNGIGLRLRFSLGAGSTFSGTAGSWSGSTFTSATGATSVVGTSGATFYITGVQLEVGSSATGFEYVDYGTQLIMCNRYFYQGTLSGAGCSGGGTAQYDYVKFPQIMRTTPTITWITGGSIGTGAASTSITGLTSTLGGTTTDTVIQVLTTSFGTAGQGQVMFGSPIFSLSSEL